MYPASMPGTTAACPYAFPSENPTAKMARPSTMAAICEYQVTFLGSIVMPQVYRERACQERTRKSHEPSGKEYLGEFCGAVLGFA